MEIKPIPGYEKNMLLVKTPDKHDQEQPGRDELMKWEDIK